ncbi:MAG TPA: M56 family metallopeptidase [Ktedonobacterales bacterium]|nr:M56 family metallopeptidase [Ktedonobacterales bacterium]
MMLVACNLLVTGLGAAVAVILLRRAPAHWPWRREVQLFVLTAPLVGLMLGIPSVASLQACVGGVVSPTQGLCVSGNTVLSERMAAIDGFMSLGMAAIVLGALVLGVVRHMLLLQVMKRTTLTAPPELQALTNHLAIQLGATQPRLRLRTLDQPLALTYGLRRPTLVLSTWMVNRFDRRELEAVLAHELAHVVRRDYLVLWLATMCRDAFCYLPTSWMALKQLQAEKEVACDDLAIDITQSPLGLASALAKVWQQAVAVPLGLAQGLTEPNDVIEGRITRLLETPQSTTPPSSTYTRPLTVQIAAVVGMLMLGTILTLGMLVLMGCGPV